MLLVCCRLKMGLSHSEPEFVAHLSIEDGFVAFGT